jgi:hypothetical protein
MNTGSSHRNSVHGTVSSQIYCRRTVKINRQGEIPMRNLTFVVAGLAALGFAVPTFNAANAETVVIKRHYDNGWHRGWRGDMGSRRVIVERHDRGFRRGFDRY